MKKKYYRIQTKDGRGIFTGIGDEVYPCYEDEWDKIPLNQAIAALEAELNTIPKNVEKNTCSAYTEKELNRLKQKGLIKTLAKAAKDYGKPIEIVEVKPTNIIYEDAQQVVFKLPKIKTR